jgi:hypothetical protein
MLDLFTPQVPVERLHPNFIAYMRRSQSHRDVLLDWSEGFVDRDGKFVIEFQTTFNASFWELYIFACLKHMGFQVDFSVPAPDFVVKRDGQRIFCIEATTANNAIQAAEEWQRDWRSAKDADIRGIVNEATLRFANSVSTKYEKYLRSYARLPTIGNLPFVLAVSPFDQPFFFLEGFHPALRVLYAVDSLDVGADGRISKKVTTATKPTGAEVPLGYFVEPHMPEISAVMFSNLATASKVAALRVQEPGERVYFSIATMDGNGETVLKNKIPKDEYHESLLDGLHLFHNPKAHYHFPQERFEFEGVAQWGFDFGKGTPFRIGSPQILLRRISAIFRVKK